MRKSAFLAVAALSLAANTAEPPRPPLDLPGTVSRIISRIDPALADPALPLSLRGGFLSERRRLLRRIEAEGLRHPGDAAVQLRVGRALLAAGEPGPARAFLDNAERLAAAAGDREALAAARTARASAADRLGDYAGAAARARSALAADPRDQEALWLYHSDKDRGPARPAAALAFAIPRVPPPTVRAPEAPRGAVPERPAPPAIPALRAPPGGGSLLVNALLRRGDANVVARATLSPLLRSGRVTIRLESPQGPHDALAGAWAVCERGNGLVRFNLDEINREIARYDALPARRPEKQVALIAPNRPLDARQAEFLAGRFLPLAVHEIGGHAADGEALRRLTGRPSAPADLDTELLAERLEAATVQAERRADPGYLTEPTPWAESESRLARLWRRGRERGLPGVLEEHLRDLGYARLFDAERGGWGAEREATRRSLELAQGRCRRADDEACRRAADLLLGAVDPERYPGLAAAARAFRAAPGDAALRAAFFRRLHAVSVLDNQLDAKGLRAAAGYFWRRDLEVSALENAVDPVKPLDRLRAFLGLEGR